MSQSSQTQQDTGGEKEQEPTIVIGLDFGTTYSGVAWTISSRPDHIKIITNWDTVKNHCSDKEKVPSAIYYDNNGEMFWGYSIPDKVSPIEWTKLCLLDEEDIPEEIRNAEQLRAAQASLRQSNRCAVDVISDYLRKLWKHSIINIRRAIGGQLVDVSRFKVVATLPAIWPAHAQLKMYEAIEKAGILKTRTAGDTILEFLSEPEAAALATIKDMYAYNNANMEVGDHFVVCDAGGGTVDVITYTVIKTNPIRVKEIVKGDGKLCGATFLDGLFLETLRRKLNQISPDAWQLLEERGALSRMIHNDWENGIKPQFRNTGQCWVLQMPASGNRRRTHDEFRFSDIELSSQDAQNIFKPVVDEIKDLIIKQAEAAKENCKKEPKFVILVGGFGRQPFLYTRLQDKLSRIIDSLGRKTEVLQGSGAEPWTAVCRGAVIRGLELSDDAIESTVDSRITRMSYGTIYNETPWEASRHDIRDRKWSNIHQAFEAAKQTSWFLFIGEDIPVGDSIVRGFHRDLTVPINSLYETFYYSTANAPSKRHDETVKKLCVVHWSSVPDFDSLPTWTNPKGRVIRRLNFDMKMTSNGVTLDFEIVYNKQVMGSEKMGIDYARRVSTVNQSRGESDDNGSEDSEEDSVC